MNPGGKSRTRLLLHLMGKRLRRIGTLFLVVYLATAGTLYALEKDAKDTKFGKPADAAWFCVVTMSTVGYGDVYPVTGAGRVVTGFFILFTLTTIGLLITALNDSVLEVKRMEDAGLIGTKFKQHVVVIGWNALTRAAIAELIAAGRKVALLVERPEDVPLARDTAEPTELFVTAGEPTQDILRDRLACAHAETGVIAMGDDAKNLIASLNFKALNAKARLIVALQAEDLRQTVTAGGATYVASPNELSGRLVASAAFEPEVAALVEDLMSGAGGGTDMQQYQAGPFAGKTVGEVQAELAAIDGPLLIGLAFREGEGEGPYRLAPHPRRDRRIAASDQLLVLADAEQAARLTQKYQVRQGR